MTYLELLDLINEAETENGLANLDQLSKELLKVVASSGLTNAKVRMRDLSKFASFPTIQAHLKVLTEAGWIERLEDESDKRSVLLRITPKTAKAFQDITDTLHRPPGITRRDHCALCSSLIRKQAFTELESKFIDFKDSFFK